MNTAGLHPLIACLVVGELFGLMGLAIDFNHKTGLSAIEIGDVWTERVL